MLMPFSTLQILAGICAIVGFFASFAALATPAWQIVYAREIQQWIQSGLWLSCQTRPSGMYTCTYTFSDSDFQFYTSAELINLRTPPFFAWQRTLLIIYLIGQLFIFLSFVTFCLSFVPSKRQFSAILCVIVTIIGVILHAGASIAFALFSQMVEYRFYHVSVSGIYEKHRGYSFFIELGAITLFIFSLILAIVHLIQMLTQTSKIKKKRQQNHQQIFEEEPYSFQQRNNFNSNFNVNSSNSNFGSSNLLTYNPYNFHGQPPDNISYQYSIRSKMNPYEESTFAMRDLPTVPMYAQNYQ